MQTAEASTVDIISSLPEAILCHILSFATTKEAVATSVLSKRWIHLWNHVNNLNFPDIKVYSDRCSLSFNEFVYSLLFDREAVGYNVINSFSLDIQYHYADLARRLGLHNITKWINLAVKSKLKYLRLRLSTYDLDYYIDVRYGYAKLPVSIFTCRTLVSLDLRCFSFEGFTFTGFSSFPSLKVLRLEYFKFSKFRDFLLFIAGCPILEVLQIYRTEFLPLEEDSLTLKEFKILSLPKLTRADLYGFRSQCFPVNALSTAKYLCIDTLKVHRWYKVNRMQHPYDVVPIFHNLTHLELHNRWDLVVQVLHQCPKLQNLTLYKYGYEDGDYQENWVEPEFVPQCLLSSLRNFTIHHDLSDLQRELMLEQYILKNARILQTMTIRCMTKQPKTERTLSMCPVASATCQITFDCLRKCL
ncbi:F-box/FBD/LRR-repeat protein At4g00160-like [Trifolium pratense]|uniref:F-box/FBD/LRR-repeat protein At4g00160-like n=1 Tax=Trifolium pratense TaxID=57577 RepID=UPI001E697C9B|nr:F-box/FBD/LRR-repeat protein At4g00160-like [Trifolium pratense]